MILQYCSFNTVILERRWVQTLFPSRSDTFWTLSLCLQCNGFHFLTLSKIRELFSLMALPWPPSAGDLPPQRAYVDRSFTDDQPCNAIVNKESY